MKITVLLISLLALSACGQNAYEMRKGLTKSQYQQTECWHALGSHPVEEIERVCGKITKEEE